MSLSAWAFFGPIAVVIQAAILIILFRWRHPVGTGLRTHYLRKNAFLVLVFTGCLFSYGSCCDLLYHLMYRIVVTVPTIDGSMSDTAIRGVTVFILLSTNATALLCAARVETLCPWEADYSKAEEIQFRRVKRSLIIFWCASNAVFGCVARVAIWKWSYEFSTGNYEDYWNSSYNPLANSDSLGEQMDSVNASMQVLVGSEAFMELYLIWWLSWEVWWSREGYVPFACPVCHGQKLVEGAACVDCCGGGTVYHHP